MKNISNNKQSGAVSLFVVIFFMLVVTVVTVSFVRLMMNDQRKSSDTDLSQSAYDSASAGVEDAKRVLLKYQADGCVGGSSATKCTDLRTAMTVCNGSVANALGVVEADKVTKKVGEVMVRQAALGTADVADKLDQAYTCVTINSETTDYEGVLAANESQLIPLYTGLKPFDRVRVDWFSKEDVSTTGGSVKLDLDKLSTGTESQALYSKGSWPVNRPSLLRAQLIQFNRNGFSVDDFDTVSAGKSDAATVFLYPTSRKDVAAEEFTLRDIRATSPTSDPAKKGPGTPLAVSCATDIDSGGFACTSELILPDPVRAASKADRTAFLRLTPFYRATHFKLTLLNGPTTVVNFKDVQPEVDSTGRANDVFRRVVSRVNLYNVSFPYPEAAVELTGNFCKDFTVTDRQYLAGKCTP